MVQTKGSVAARHVLNTRYPTGHRAISPLWAEKVSGMGVIELVDQSAAIALEHASALEAHLRTAGDASDPELLECREEMHQLVADIVSLRNAAELLKREIAQPAK